MREIITAYLEAPGVAFHVWWVFVGLMVGSFINVVAYRLPLAIMSETEEDARKYSLLRNSACPHCAAPIRSIDNIPVVSWLVLKARCRSCSASIPVRYLLVELAGGAIAATALANFGATPEALVVSSAGWLLLCASLCDFDTMYIPASVSGGLMWLGLLSATFGIGFIGIHEAVIGGASAFVLPWLLNTLYKTARGVDGLGYGDFHLLAGIGALAGGTYAWLCLTLAAISSLAYALIVTSGRLAGSSHEGQVGPFGPWIAGSAVCALPLHSSLPSLTWLMGLGVT